MDARSRSHVGSRWITERRRISLDTWDRQIVSEKVPNTGRIVLTANDYHQFPDEASVPALHASYVDEPGRFPRELGLTE